MTWRTCAREDGALATDHGSSKQALALIHISREPFQPENPCMLRERVVRMGDHDRCQTKRGVTRCFFFFFNNHLYSGVTRYASWALMSEPSRGPESVGMARFYSMVGSTQIEMSLQDRVVRVRFRCYHSVVRRRAGHRGKVPRIGSGVCGHVGRSAGRVLLSGAGNMWDDTSSIVRARA